MSKPQFILYAGGAAIAMAIAYRMANLMIDRVLPKMKGEEEEPADRRQGQQQPRRVEVACSHIFAANPSRAHVDGGGGGGRAGPPAAPARWYWEESPARLAAHPVVKPPYWIPYDDAASARLEKAFVARQGKIQLTAAYEADVERMLQTNLRTGFSRKLLRDAPPVVPVARPASRDVETPLWDACRTGHVNAARLLLDKGAEVDRADKDGATPLYIACQQGHVDVARLLLEKGAEVDRAKEDGATPLSIARSQGHSSIVALLEAPMMEAET